MTTTPNADCITPTPTTEIDRPASVALSAVVSAPQHPIIHGIAYEEAVTVLAGAAGSGKSTIARQWAAAVSVGADWPAGKADPDNAGVVLWLASEESPAQVRGGFERLGVDVDLDRVRYARIDHVQRPADLAELAIVTLANLIVVDPAADLLNVGDWNAYGVVRAAVRRWAGRLMYPYCGCGMLLLHHQNRRGSYLGSSGLAGAVDILAEWNTAPGNARELCTVKTRVQAVPPGGRSCWAFDGRRYHPAGKAPIIEAPGARRADDVTPRVDAYLLEHPGANKRKIGAALGIRPGGGWRWAALSAAFEART